eukprot:348204-Rhodomonas_salina.2
MEGESLARDLGTGYLANSISRPEDFAGCIMLCLGENRDMAVFKLRRLHMKRSESECALHTV